MLMFAFKFKVRTKIILTKTKPFNRQIVIIQMSWRINIRVIICSKCSAVYWHEHMPSASAAADQ